MNVSPITHEVIEHPHLVPPYRPTGKASGITPTKIPAAPGTRRLKTHKSWSQVLNFARKHRDSPEVPKIPLGAAWPGRAFLGQTAAETEEAEMPATEQQERYPLLSSPASCGFQRLMQQPIGRSNCSPSVTALDPFSSHRSVSTPLTNVGCGNMNAVSNPSPYIAKLGNSTGKKIGSGIPSLSKSAPMIDHSDGLLTNPAGIGRPHLPQDRRPVTPKTALTAAPAPPISRSGTSKLPRASVERQSQLFALGSPASPPLTPEKDALPEPGRGLAKVPVRIDNPAEAASQTHLSSLSQTPRASSIKPPLTTSSLVSTAKQPKTSLPRNPQEGSENALPPPVRGHKRSPRKQFEIARPSQIPALKVTKSMEWVQDPSPSIAESLEAPPVPPKDVDVDFHRESLPLERSPPNSLLGFEAALEFSPAAHTVKRLSVAAPEHGPQLRVFRSAEGVMMGDEPNRERPDSSTSKARSKVSSSDTYSCFLTGRSFDAITTSEPHALPAFPVVTTSKERFPYSEDVAVSHRASLMDAASHASEDRCESPASSAVAPMTNYLPIDEGTWLSPIGDSLIASHITTPERQSSRENRAPDSYPPRGSSHRPANGLTIKKVDPKGSPYSKSNASRMMPSFSRSSSEPSGQTDKRPIDRATLSSHLSNEPADRRDSGQATARSDHTHLPSVRNSLAELERTEQCSPKKGVVKSMKALFQKKPTSVERGLPNSRPGFESFLEGGEPSNIPPKAKKASPSISEVPEMHRPKHSPLKKKSRSNNLRNMSSNGRFSMSQTDLRGQSQAGPSTTPHRTTVVSASAADQLIETTRMTLELLTEARTTIDSPRQIKLIDVSTLLVDAIKLARDGSKAVQEAKEAARQAEVDNVLCLNSLNEAYNAVKAWNEASIQAQAR